MHKKLCAPSKNISKTKKLAKVFDKKICATLTYRILVYDRTTDNYHFSRAFRKSRFGDNHLHDDHRLYHGRGGSYPVSSYPGSYPVVAVDYYLDYYHVKMSLSGDNHSVALLGVPMFGRGIVGNGDYYLIVNGVNCSCPYSE